MLQTKKRLIKMEQEERQFILDVKAWAMSEYDNGGDFIIECFTDQEILEQFDALHLQDVKDWCELKNDLRKEVESTVW